MIRIGSLSEKHDRRAQKEGFANKEGDSDAEFFDDEEQNIDLSMPEFGDSTSVVPPSINSNRNSLTADALRQFRKNLPSTNFDNTSASKLSYASRGPLSKNQMVVGSRITSHLRLEFIKTVNFRVAAKGSLCHGLRGAIRRDLFRPMGAWDGRVGKSFDQSA